MIILYNGILLSYEKNEMLIHATRWICLENINLSERPKKTIAWIYKKVQNRKIYRIRKQDSRGLRLKSWGEMGSGMLAKDYGYFFTLGNENILKLVMVIIAELLE